MGESFGVGGGGSVATPALVTKIKATGNKSVTTTKGPIDATNLPFVTMALAVGDRVKLTLSCSVLANAVDLHLDFEVDQPTSANIYTGSGKSERSHSGSSEVAVSVVATFTATEAGVHGFRPVAQTGSGTATVYNAAAATFDAVAIDFIVEKLP